MKNCWKHSVCQQGPIQGPGDIGLLIGCMLARDILVEVDGRYITAKTNRNRWVVRRA